MKWELLRLIKHKLHSARWRRHARRLAHRSTMFGEAAEVLEDRCLLSTLIVNDDGGGDFLTVQAAINASIAGDTILINGGADRIHTEQGITVNKDLTIQGDTNGPQVIVQAAPTEGVATERVFAVTARVTIDNLVIRHGAGSYAGGGILNGGVLILSNSTVTRNTSSEGGGVYNSGANLTVLNSSVSQNSASVFGAGIVTNGPSAITRVMNSTVSDNAGVGINHFAGTLELTNSTVARNRGGIIASNLGPITLTNCTVSENSSYGVSAFGTFINSTISRNLGTGIVSLFGTVNLLNSTVTQNMDNSRGGGIVLSRGFTASDLNLVSSIVAGNFLGTTPSDIEKLEESVVTSTNSLIGDANSSGGVVHGQNGNIVGNNGVGTININTVLDTTLRDNGGPTLTHALVAGSPAIDNGSNPQDLLYDQRGPGFARTLMSATDIGAVEFTPFDPDLIPVVAFGSGGGMEAEVRVLNSTLDEVFRLIPYPGFTGGVRVALGDVTGDGVTDVITAAGKGGGPHVKVFDGRTAQEIVSFFAYGPLFTGGVFVATADLDNDGRADIITGAGEGGGPHVRAWSSADGSPLFDFFAYGALFTGGVRVAAGDINDDGRPDIITGAGPGGGPHVRVFDGTRPDLAAMDINIPGPWGSFFAYDASYTGGVFVAANNSDTPNAPLIVTGSSQNILAGASVGIFNSPQQGNAEFQLPNYQGVRVAVLDYDRDGINDYLTATGPGISGQMFLFSGASNHPILPIGEILASDFPFGEFYQGGIFVAGTTLNLDLF